MSVRSSTFVLEEGDVFALEVIHLADHCRLVIHHEDKEAPLIQALLSASECHSLAAALECAANRERGARRPFRQLRPLDS